MSRKNNRNKIKAQYELEVRALPSLYGILLVCVDVELTALVVCAGREGEGAQGEAADEARASTLPAIAACAWARK